MIKLLLGDTIDCMKEIEANSIDLILCDLPYSMVNRKSKHKVWDNTIPPHLLWGQYKRILKPNSTIVLFGSGIFTAKIILSNPKWYKYSLVWKKGNYVSGFLNANRRPMVNHEDIMIFHNGRVKYNPQFKIVSPRVIKNHGQSNIYDKVNPIEKKISNKEYPRSIIEFSRDSQKYHPTQKPIALLEYLIKTYSNKGEMVLDNTMGSGSTGVAAIRCGRDFIGIERELSFFEIAKDRIEGEDSKYQLFK